MDEQAARRIIHETFESEFDRSKFLSFIVNLLRLTTDDIERTRKGPWQGSYIPESFQEYISKYERIARYITEDGKKLDILVVYVKDTKYLQRARTAQRNFVASYLAGKYGSTSIKDAALVAFVSPDTSDWRFSLVRTNYILETTPDRGVKVKEELTPPKRWSFLVGKNERSHTIQSRMLPLLTSEAKGLTLDELQNAFDVEIVTKEFFEKYRDLFIRTKIELDKIVENDKKVKEEFEKKKIHTVDFVKKLLGQITFLYFLQKKGWFGVEKGQPWGTGPKNFMRQLYERRFGDYRNFYNDILEPLFYEALTTDRSAYDHYYSRFDCKIPFLNGGLFDPMNEYDWVNTEILLPNELFSNKNRTKEGDIGDGILDVFDRYNFTVSEEEPLEKEVALDPELLGKIYEKLNAIRDDNFDEYLKALKTGEESKFNKEYGVYYTPREIVHFMCQQTLIEYLETELSVLFPNEQDLRQNIEDFVTNAEALQEWERTSVKKLQAIENGLQRETKYEPQIPEFVRQNADTIDKTLANVKICDPAVGSGAFPIGMMHEIVKLRTLLSIYISNNITQYDLKRHTIENSLYGVDIDAGAVEVCKLRFWLSLIVDEDDFYNIKPLPNLDYKILCGNSLLTIEHNLFNSNLIVRLEALKHQYFSETNPERKHELRKEIDELVYLVTNGHKEFDLEISFYEVFHQNGGFDIVIGNPPYGVNYDRGTFEKLKRKFEYSDTQNNSASFFIELSSMILRDSGIATYIVPKSLTFSNGWSKTRRFLLNKNKLILVADLSEAFENVLLEQVIISFSRKQECSYYFDTLEAWKKEITFITSSSTSLTNELDMLPIYATRERMDILRKRILSSSVKLGKISKTFRGLPLQSKITSDGDIAVVRGKNIRKYKIYGDFDKVSSKDTIRFDEKIKLMRNRKIVSQNIVAHVMQPYDRIIIMSALDDEKRITLDTVVNTVISDSNYSYEYILAIMNSKLAAWFYYWFVYNRAIRTMHFDEYYVGKLPIKLVDPSRKKLVKRIETLVNLVIASKDGDSDQNDLLKEIDTLIYCIYELNDEEIELVEGKS